jgi:hypothetical protein
LAQNQAATSVDIQTLSDQVYRQHALRLLREHASAMSIEIWRDEAVIDVVDRIGGRPDAGAGGVASIG